MANFRIVGGGDLGVHVNDPNILLPSNTLIEPTLLVGSRVNLYKTGYYKVGTKVTMVFGVGGLTSNANNTLFVLPEGFRPTYKILSIGEATSSMTTYYCAVAVNPNGNVEIAEPNNSSATFAFATITFDAAQ